jgi:acetyltransferase
VNLDSLFEPESIAVVGASQTEGKIGYESMANASLYDGRIHPVNPSGDGTLFGAEFSASVADIDDDVDLVLCCVPARVVPDVLEESGEADVDAAVIHAGGFAEAGEDGERLQSDIVGIADEYDMALLGPNTSGFVRPGKELFATFAAGVDEIQPGNVAVLAQSGGVAHQLGFHAQREGRGISAMLGLGNRANVGFEEVIDYFDADPGTDAIVLHVEGTDEREALMATCRRAETPVVAYKVGETDVSDFAGWHTGAAPGDYEEYRRAFAEAGVPTVTSSVDLFDAGQALADSPEPDGTDIGVVTAQAGPGIVITDRIQSAGRTFPELDDETHDRLDDILPGITYTENPVDTGRPMPEFGEVVEAVAADDNVDILLVYELFEEALGLPVDAIERIADGGDLPVIVATEGPVEAMADDVADIRDAGVPVYSSPERGVEATLAVAAYADLLHGAE